MNVTTTDRFTIRDAAELYGLPAWGARYLAISEDGGLRVTPDRSGRGGIDVHDVRCA